MGAHRSFQVNLIISVNQVRFYLKLILIMVVLILFCLTWSSHQQGDSREKTVERITSRHIQVLKYFLIIVPQQSRYCEACLPDLFACVIAFH